MQQCRQVLRHGWLYVSKTEACPWVGDITGYRVIVYLKAHFSLRHLPRHFTPPKGAVAWRATTIQCLTAFIKHYLFLHID